MESTSKKQNTPKLWYWGEPKGGMSLEDCEKIVKEIRILTGKPGLRICI